MDPQQHEQHMAQIMQGLQAILASEDINEIKQIAQSLIQAEQGEAQAEAPEAGLKEQLMAKMQGQQ